MAESIESIELIGANDRQNALFRRVLQTSDPCFGRAFSATAAECRQCLTPVLASGRLQVLREVCAATCRAARSGRAATLVPWRRLPAADVVRMLEAGRTVHQVFLAALGNASLPEYGRAVRAFLYRRLHYLRERGMPAPELPPLAELERYARDHAEDPAAAR